MRTTMIWIALATISVSVLTSLGVTAAIRYDEKQRATPEHFKIFTPTAYRYEFCFVRPGTPVVYLFGDGGIRELKVPGTDWNRLVARIGNEGWDLVGQGPDEAGKPVLYFKRGRQEKPN
jgi:hypothetical protein